MTEQGAHSKVEVLQVFWETWSLNNRESWTFPALLAWKPIPLLHRILVPLCFIAVVLDTLTITYSIG